MKKFLLLSFVTLFFASFTQAKIFRLGYPGNPLAGTDFTDYASLEAAASVGDTVQVYGNQSIGNVRKRLVFIGFGYNVDAQNPNLQAVNTHDPSVVNITFRLGSSGSVVTGLSGTIYIQESSDAASTIENIRIERFTGGIHFYNYKTYGSIKNINIISSAIYGGLQYSDANSKPVTGIGVFNSIVGNASYGGFNLYNTGTTAVFQNCVAGIDYYFVAPNEASVLFENCIVGNHTPGASSVYNYCIFSGTPTPLGTGNQYGKARADIFTRNGGTDDAEGNPLNVAKYDEDYYRLKAGSPAIGAGKIGATTVDCGIFGGSPAYYYKLGNVPAVPAIYQLTAPSGTAASSNPYNITISVRANN